MARPLKLYPANLPITDQEEQARQEFISSYSADYGPFSESDRIILELASFEFVKSIRLQVHELTTGNILTAARQHPLNQLVKLLDMMSATRSAKIRSKQPVNEAEDEALQFFMSLSETPTRSSNHAK